MAHQLDEKDGRASMAYVGDLPWHGLGQQLTADADLATWTKEAGMDFVIEPSAIWFKPNTGKNEVYPDKKILYRSDTKAPLSIVGQGYNIVQPKDIMEFFSSLIDGFGFKMETAGVLFGGRKFWALARTGESFNLAKKKSDADDVIDPFVLLATACDGTMATVGHRTSVRVVCSNTLRMSIGENGKLAKVRVPHSLVVDFDDIKAQLEVGPKVWKEFTRDISKLAAFQVSRELAIDVVAAELKAEWKKPETEDEMAGEEKLEASVALRRIIQLFDGAGRGSSFASSKGTAWGLVNAVTEYYDHEAGQTRNGDRSRAFERAHLLDRAVLKTKVADRLLALAA